MEDQSPAQTRPADSDVRLRDRLGVSGLRGRRLRPGTEVLHVAEEEELQGCPERDPDLLPGGDGGLQDPREAVAGRGPGGGDGEPVRVPQVGVQQGQGRPQLQGEQAVRLPGQQRLQRSEGVGVEQRLGRLSKSQSQSEQEEEEKPEEILLPVEIPQPTPGERQEEGETQGQVGVREVHIEEQFPELPEEEGEEEIQEKVKVTLSITAEKIQFLQLLL